MMALAGPLVDAGYRTGYRAAYRLMRAWWFVRRPYNHGVWVAVWHGSRLLLVRCSYRRWLTLPGGFVGRGEDFADAGARELAEEVGIAAAPWHLAPAGAYYHETDYLRDVIHIFELPLTEQPAVRVDRREIVSAEFIEAEQALTMTLLPPLRHYLEGRDALRAGRDSAAWPIRSAIDSAVRLART